MQARLHSGFVGDGFAVLDGFLTPAEIREVALLVESRLRAPHGGQCERPHNTLLPLRFDDRVVAIALGRSERLARLAAAVDADDLRWISGYVSSKEPRSAPLLWHQDWWCWDHPVSFRRTSAQIALLCYLTAVDETNGGLRLLPGSNHRSTALHAVLPEAHSEESDAVASEHVAMDDVPGQLTLRLRAGDAVAIDYRLLHGTHANASNNRRDCLLLSFTPSWRKLPSDVRAHLVSHPAQPAAGETPPAWQAALLPHFAGRRRDLPLNRNAPRRFAIAP